MFVGGVGHGVILPPGDVTHASLHIWLAFAPGSLVLINPLYSELYKI